MGNSKYALNKPTVIIASCEDIDFSKHKRLFRRNGLECLVITDRLKLIEEAIKPGCFAVFLDDTFDSEALKILAEVKRHSRAFWVYCIRGEVARNMSQKAIASGANLLLFRPKEAEQYLLRARQMLARFEGKQIPLSANDRASKRFSPKIEQSVPAKTAPLPVPLVEPKAKEPVVPPVKKTIAPTLSVKLAGEIFDEDFSTINPSKSFELSRPTWAEALRLAQSGSFQNFESLSIAYRRLLSQLIPMKANATLSLLSVRLDSPLQTSTAHVRRLVENVYDENFTLDNQESVYPDVAQVLKTSHSVYVSNISEARSFQRSFGLASVASFPIFSPQALVAGVLRLQLNQNANFLIKQSYLEDLASFAPHLYKGFRSLEFFARIYARNSEMYENMR